jgi:hypothetical protein
MREIRTSGSEGGARSIPCPYPYRGQGAKRIQRLIQFVSGLMLVIRLPDGKLA